jgi:hypothetical protein
MCGKLEDEDSTAKGITSLLHPFKNGIDAVLGKADQHFARICAQGGSEHGTCFLSWPTPQLHLQVASTWQEGRTKKAVKAHAAYGN